MLGRIVGAVRFKEALSFHTSMHIGGPAEFFIEPQDLDDVRHALAFADQEGLPVTAIGGGTNLVVADRGVRGVVLKLQGIFARTQFEGAEAVVGAGMSLGAFIREAAARGLGGLECFAGIPGTLGGALAMNVEVGERALIDRCAQIYFLQPDGTLGDIRTAGGVSAADYTLPTGSLILGCRIPLSRRPSAHIHKEIHRHLKLKKAAEPLALASLGYVWRNPNGGESAAQLIARVGLRGKRVKTVEISAKCANFIVNRGGATASDVLALMEMTHERVAAHTGVTLEAEIRTSGLDAIPFQPRPFGFVPV
jgi:UDP-N-acetylmuramate dehydrogenase